MRTFFRENGLSCIMLAFFVIFVVGQSITGYANYNDEQRSHKQPDVSYGTYLQSGDFMESVFENWESEFLQMGAYVIFTAFLFQKGSSESKSLTEKDPVDEDPALQRSNPKAPWPVRKGGRILGIYTYSLSIALFLLFLLSFTLHAIGGARAYCHEQLQHGEACVSTLAYLVAPRFWFESFQNWQSEFLSIGVFVLLSIVLRHRGSPESKPVASPHSETGQ